MKSKITSSLKITLVCLLAFACLFACAACGSGQAARQTATTFFNRLEKGNFSGAAKLCSSDAKKQLGDGLTTASLREKFMTGLNSTGQNISYDSLSEASQKSIDDAMDYLMKAAVKSYKLNDDYDDDAKTITAEVRYIDTDSLSISALTSQTETLAEKYWAAHQSELLKTYQTSGQDATVAQLLDAILPDIMSSFKTDVVDKAKVIKKTWRLTFKEQDGDWIISKIETEK